MSNERVIWGAIDKAGICEPGEVPPVRFEGILVARPAAGDEWGWLIGPYRSLTRLATALRVDPGLRAAVSSRSVRFGTRESDTPWKDDEMGRMLQRRIGPRIDPVQSDFSGQRVATLLQPLNAAPPLNRGSDQYQNVKSFWETQTLESHHIVEHATLKRIGVSRENVDDDFHRDNLPCVLLMAELHRRYVTAYLREQRDRFHPGMSAADAFKALQVVFGGMYSGRGSILRPLYRIAEKVNEAVRDFLAGSQAPPKGTT